MPTEVCMLDCDSKSQLYHNAPVYNGYMYILHSTLYDFRTTSNPPPRLEL